VSTSTLELIELNVNLDEEIPCEQHTEVPAKYRVNHSGPTCSFFVCTQCKENIQRVLDKLHMHIKICNRGHDHVCECKKCESEIDFLTLRITSLD